LSKMALSLPMTIAVIPGGPGLTCSTLQDVWSMDLPLNRVPIDPPSSEVDTSYSEIIDSARDQITAIEGKVILMGHSFGGVVAADIALRERDKIAGVICIATPFSQIAWSAITERYSALKTELMKKNEDLYLKEPTNERFSAWLASYEHLYFASHSVSRGTAMLRAASFIARAHLGASKEGASQEHLLENLRRLPMRKPKQGEANFNLLQLMPPVTLWFSINQIK
jgi:pimeloyl-ACP methyl ester carboxylesterase